MIRIMFAAAIVLLTLASAASAPAKKADCSWGASSVVAWVDASGAIHQSEPSTTGCIP